MTKYLAVAEAAVMNLIMMGKLCLPEDEDESKSLVWLARKLYFIITCNGYSPTPPPPLTSPVAWPALNLMRLLHLLVMQLTRYMCRTPTTSARTKCPVNLILTIKTICSNTCPSPLPLFFFGGQLELPTS